MAKVTKEKDYDATRGRARELAWSTMLDMLQNPKIEDKIRYQAARDVLEATGDLVKKNNQQGVQNQLTINVNPDHLAQAIGAVKLLGQGESSGGN